MTELELLKQSIDFALENCQTEISQNCINIFSEADLERMLANEISKTIAINNKYSVHCQLSHYTDGKAHVDARPDILLLNEEVFLSKLDDAIKYEGPSIAIELKYLRLGGSTTIVNKDFLKWQDKLDNQNWLYVVALVEIGPNSRKGYQEKRTEIKNMLEEMKDRYPNYMVFCYVLLKELSEMKKIRK